MSAPEFPLWLRRVVAVITFTAGVIGAYAWADSKIDGKIEDRIEVVVDRLDRIESKLDALLLRRK